MEKKLIATIGSMHVCPMVTGVTPHVGGPIIGPGEPGILINGQPVAVLGDQCVCSGPPDVIVTACPVVLINGKPVATVGSMTAHGGQIITGAPGVSISSATPMKPAVVPLRHIPFPEISLTSQLLASSQANYARQEQQKVKECVAQKDDKPKKVFNLQWKYKDVIINEGETEQKVLLTADTWGYEDNEEVKFSIYLPDDDNGEEGEVIEEVLGKVLDSHIEIEWEIDKEKIKEKQDGQKEE